MGSRSSRSDSLSSIGYIDTTDPSMNYPVSAKCFKVIFPLNLKEKLYPDVRLVIDNGAKKKKIYDFQIKANSPEQQDGSNLKFESHTKRCWRC